MLRLKEYDVQPLLPSAPVSDPRISPCGEQIVFVRTTVDMAADKYVSHLYLVPSGGGEPKQLTYGDGNDNNPFWSPDSKTVYFLSNRSIAEKDEKRTVRLWALPISGGEAKPIASAKSGITRPRLSPDGKTVLFLSRIQEETESRPADDKSDVMWVTKLNYKLDGEPFFPYTRVHLFRVSAEGGEPLQLTKGCFDIVSANWSHDSNNIAFVTNTEDYDHSLIRDAYIVPATGGEPRKVTNSNIMSNSVSWAPDGRLLAFTGYVPTGPNFRGYRNTGIWVIPPGGGKEKNITESFPETVSAGATGPQWSSDSNTLYFTAPHHGATNIHKVDAHTGQVTPVTDSKITVSSFSLSKADQLAFDASESTWPAEVWFHSQGTTRCVTSINADIMKNLKMIQPDEFWFTASDGVRVQGWIIKPTELKEGAKCPTIVEVHGGPMGLYGYTPSLEFQILARHGYAVVYTNPRMSTGYGESFTAECSGHYGEKDYSDIMEALDHATANYPFIDPERLGVTGGSYGGFMTNWIIGHTDKFKAAVSQRSISNWSSFFGVSDIGPTWVPWQVGFGKDPWQDVQRHADKSPITYVENVKTPTLIVESEEDWRCPIEQGEQLYTALKKLRKEVELLRFPKESHGLSGGGKPSHRVELYRHVLRWFDKYLKNTA